MYLIYIFQCGRRAKPDEARRRSNRLICPEHGRSCRLKCKELMCQNPTCRKLFISTSNKNPKWCPECRENEALHQAKIRRRRWTKDYHSTYQKHEFWAEPEVDPIAGRPPAGGAAYRQPWETDGMPLGVR